MGAASYASIAVDVPVLLIPDKVENKGCHYLTVKLPLKR